MSAIRAKVLVTGPCGRVGSQIIPLLRRDFQLRLMDVRPVQAVEDDEVVQGDIRDFDLLRTACDGVHALVHLAAVPDEDDFLTKLLPMNIAGVYNAFEAARQANVSKVIFASTAQTVLHYPRGQWITPEMPARPWTVYACTKMFGEALARHYSDQHGVPAIVLRIAWFQPYDSQAVLEHPEGWPEWCSPRDLTQLITKSIRSDLRYALFFGVSDNEGRYWDITNAKELVGYEPEDNAANWFGRLAAQRPVTGDGSAPRPPAD